MEMTETAKWVKRRIDAVYDDPGINPRPRKQLKLSPAEEQTGTNALPKKKHELRGKAHSPELESKQGTAKLSEQETLQFQATEKPPKTKRPPTGRTQITRMESALKLWQADMNQKLKEVKEQQEADIKKAVRIAIEDKVADAIDEAEAAAYEEVKRVFVEDLPKGVEKTVAARLPEEVEKVQEAIAKDADEAVKKAIATNNAEFGRMKAELEQEKKKAADELQDVRHQLEKSRQKLDTQHKKLAILANEYEAAISAEKEADEKREKALEQKKASESAIANMQQDIARRHSQLLKRQRIQLEFIRVKHEAQIKRKRALRGLILSPHHRGGSEMSTVESMDLDEAAYPSPPNSQCAQQTPNSWSQSQNSTSRFTSSTSSTTNDASTHDDKPRQGLMWNVHRIANPFASSTPSKVIDPENIAMHNHSRIGFSSSAPALSDESDEEFPLANASSSQFRQSQSPAQQAIVSFGRPSVGHLAHLEGQQQPVSPYTPEPSSLSHIHRQRLANTLPGAGQSNSRCASRNTAGQANYPQQHGSDLNGAGQSNSHRAPRNTAFQTEYAQQHANDFNGARQSNPRRAAPPSRPQNAAIQWRQTTPSNNNMPNSSGTPRPVRQNTRTRNQGRVNDYDGAQSSKFGYAASQSHYQGSDVNTPPAHLTGHAQTTSSYTTPQSHSQDSFAQSGPAPPNGSAQQADFCAQPRLAANNQRIAASGNLTGPSQGQPHNGPRVRTTNGRGGARGGRGGARGGRGGASNGRGGASNGRGGASNGRGSASNGHGSARDQPYDGDDEHDRRQSRQHGANRSQRQAQTAPGPSRKDIREANNSLQKIIDSGI
jgi:hypothetical protein